jgi:hypothetical protein
MPDITFEGISFNSEWAITKSETAFVAEFEGVHPLTPDQLREVYNIIHSIHWGLPGNGGGM